MRRTLGVCSGCKLFIGVGVGSFSSQAEVLSQCFCVCCCRLSFGMGADGQVAMKVVSRGSLRRPVRQCTASFKRHRQPAKNDATWATMVVYVMFVMHAILIVRDPPVYRCLFCVLSSCICACMLFHVSCCMLTMFSNKATSQNVSLLLK